MPAMHAAQSPTLLGVDFSSAPTRRKPIVAAWGRLHGAVLRLDRLEARPDLPAFESLLTTPGPWFGAFDFPFGLPREFVDALGLGADTDTVIGVLHTRCGSRMGFRALVDGWNHTRPAGLRLDRAAHGFFLLVGTACCRHVSGFRAPVDLVRLSGQPADDQTELTASRTNWNGLSRARDLARQFVIRRERDDGRP